MPLPAKITQLQDQAVGALVRRTKRSTNGPSAVRWLSVPQLYRTAAEVVQASAFARFADKREAMASAPREYYRLPPPPDGRPVWIDYVSDTGDGFDSTFATAVCLSGPPGLVVTASATDPGPAVFPGRPTRADLLVLGGDEVYPVPSAGAYETRLNDVLRLSAGLAGQREIPPLVALPGNHDWYDGLGAFRRNFCESWVLRGHNYEHPAGPQLRDIPPPAQRDEVGGWSAFQSRSYFAVQLSPRWWLWALDSQLDAPIDAEQLAYFHDARRLLGDADIILCTASPSWLEAGGDRVYAAMADTPFYTLLWFIDRVLGTDRDRVRLLLTGDEHHYARYSPVEEPPVPPAESATRSLTATGPANTSPFAPELVTCGGGGAFLASTHHLPDTLTAAWQPWPTGSGSIGRYRLRNCYPSREMSKRLNGFPRFLAAAWRNGPSLPLLLGGIDFLLTWSMLTGRDGLYAVTALAMAGFITLYAISGTKSLRPAWRRVSATIALVVCHVAAHLGVAWLAAALLRITLPPDPPMAARLLAYPLVFLLVAALGTVVFVTYLRVADWFGSHTLEAFSGLRLEKFRSHLRLRITDDGVDVHVIGMPTVPATRHAIDPGAHLPHPHLVETFSVRPHPGPRSA